MSAKPEDIPGPGGSAKPSSLGSGTTTAAPVPIHAYIWYSLPLLVKASLAVNGLLCTLAAETLWDQCWGLVFVLLALFGACLALYLIRCTWLQRLTPEQVRGVVTPPLHTIRMRACVCVCGKRESCCSLNPWVGRWANMELSAPCSMAWEPRLPVVPLDSGGPY